MTYEEFLDWADEDSRAEWVDGRVVVASPASARHQNMVGFVYRIVARYVELRGLGQIFTAPFQQKLLRSGREPDVLFVASAHLDRLQPPRKPNRVVGPADLVVEVVSVPESVERDRVDKFREYQRGGVPEYWVIDPTDHQADFYHLNAQSVY
jgi:Uma2 family endonuclease